MKCQSFTMKSSQLSFTLIGCLPSCSWSCGCFGNKYVWNKNDERRTRRSHLLRLKKKRLNLSSSLLKDSEPGDKQNLDACADKVDVDVKQLYDLPAEYSSPMSGDDFGLALERTLLALRNRLDRKDFDKIFDRNDPFIGEL
ncbi:uncharacterized protein Gasu_52710 [Galdieria sulphuraria]|uniref:Uncharacterized protein n=1 Tax=Galdieria sulphuraria TaxID=130081 RepID=M2XUS5_GALSU|nr:uncharacterized protein Gasu_52710 [Galdieria sulphuraria]EME27169.1 hypothetical protein Gasu_52710 [Galdieria sulphuraria]|eukprot:XP_005703689.1 hypothetical protein Gasu_52710 [Galdieria sulphuraria]